MKSSFSIEKDMYFSWFCGMQSSLLFFIFPIACMIMWESYPLKLWNNTGIRFCWFILRLHALCAAPRNLPVTINQPFFHLHHVFNKRVGKIISSICHMIFCKTVIWSNNFICKPRGMCFASLVVLGLDTLGRHVETLEDMHSKSAYMTKLTFCCMETSE